jgi:hypothetical protein
MTQVQIVEGARRGRPPKTKPSGYSISPSNIPLIHLRTVTSRYAEVHGHKPSTAQSSRLLVSGVLELASLRAERRNCSDLERRLELTASIEGVLTDICELLDIAAVKTAATNMLLKDRAHPARKVFLEETDDSDKKWRVHRFADDLRTERRTLVGFYGAKRDRMLTSQRRLVAFGEELSPDQKIELAVCTHRFAALKERQGDRLRAEAMLPEVNTIGRHLSGQRSLWLQDQLETTFGIDVTVTA